jgi:exodeoxyribonuclease VII large subunit
MRAPIARSGNQDNGREQPPAVPALPNAAISLRDLLGSIQQALRKLPRAWVLAEVQKVSIGEKVSSIELIETDAAGKVVAKARVKFWRVRWQEIERRFADLGLRIEVGTKILVQVQADLQPAFGFELDGHDIDPSYTLGDLATRLVAFREKLKQEGLFDRQARLPAPLDFQRVAVITPALSAGGADFERLTRRLHELGLVEIVTCPAIFQSATASQSIRDALRSIFVECRRGRYCAVALVRGGGASADLAHLADYDLARAICLMPVPVLVGIGHEVDRTLLDEVAHLSLPTPSAVAGHIMKTVAGNCALAERAILSIRHFVGSDTARLERTTADCLAAARDGGRRAVEQAEVRTRRTTYSLEPDVRSLLALADRYVREAEDAARGTASAAREAAEGAIRCALGDIVTDGRTLLEPGRRGLDSASATIRSAPQTLLHQATTSLAAAMQTVAQGPAAALQRADWDIVVALQAVQERPESILQDQATGLRAAIVSTEERAGTITRTGEAALSASWSAVRSTALPGLDRLEDLVSDALTALLHHADVAPGTAGSAAGELLRGIEEAAALSMVAVTSSVSDARAVAGMADPKRLLASGYAILRAPDGRPLTTTATLRAEPVVQAELNDGITPLKQ